MHPAQYISLPSPRIYYHGNHPSTCQQYVTNNIYPSRPKLLSQIPPCYPVSTQFLHPRPSSLCPCRHILCMITSHFTLSLEISVLKPDPYYMQCLACSLQVCHQQAQFIQRPPEPLKKNSFWIRDLIVVRARCRLSQEKLHPTEIHTFLTLPKCATTCMVRPC